VSRARLAAVLFALSAGAAVAQPDEVVIRVVDTGPGLCTVTVMPGGHYMVFDAGHWSYGRCQDAVEELVPEGATIDLVVLSHSDSDHLASADEILATYRVGTLIWAPYFRRPAQASAPTTWKNVRAAIRDALDDGTLAEEWNLARRRLVPGTELRFGDIRLTLLSGFNRPPLRWGLRNDPSKHKNAGTWPKASPWRASSAPTSATGRGATSGTRAPGRRASGTRSATTTSRSAWAPAA
jgi:Metallo-beta-lactamase superfamily